MAKLKEFTSRDSRGRLRHHRRKRLMSLCTARTSVCFLLGFFLFATTGWIRCLRSGSTTKVNAHSSHAISRWRKKQGFADEDNREINHESVKKQRQFLPIGKSLVSKKIPAGQFLTRRQNHNKATDGISLVSDNESRHALYTEEDYRISELRGVNRKIPTPWPINVLQERWNSRRESSSQAAAERKDVGTFNDGGTGTSSYPSMGALFFAYAKQQARIGFRQFSEISSQIWYNLPPSTPPLLLLASIPRNVKLVEGRKVTGAASGESLRRIIPVFSDPFARTIVLAGLGMAVVSWSNQELQRKRKLTPLALSALTDEYGVKGAVPVSRVFLPPFLPEVVPEPEIDALRGTTADESNLGNVESDELAANGFEEKILSNVSPKIRRHLNGIYETTTTTSRRFFRNYYKDWLQGRAVRKREVAKIRRNRIFDELVALQVLKKKRQTTSRNNLGTNASLEPELGYALVTGASRGIGRAIAVELARWEIPLVLVARDVDKLAQLASDLESCYGVKCCILEADLSKADAAEKIHQATTEAGISVDILVNNAGLASEGLAVDSKTSFVDSMITLNSLSYAKLGVLYGRDMKEKRRGRILMMSSMAGLCNASPNTAVYGACKAFGKSLALSMAKEMEKYGVGVTCLIPGAVSDTDFRQSSGTRKALCWYLPFYSRSPDIVAHQGVVSLLDGDTQSIPGWQNRAFANIVRPIIPQRLEVMIVQLAFTPLRLPSLRDLLRRDKENVESDNVEGLTSAVTPRGQLSPDGDSSWLSMKPRYAVHPPPRFLKLPEDEPEKIETPILESNNETLSNEETSSSLPEMTGTTINSESGEISERDTDKSKSTLNTPNSNDRTENTGLVNQIEPETTGRQPRASVTQHEEHSKDENAHNSNENNHSKNRHDGCKAEEIKLNGVQHGNTYNSLGEKSTEYNKDKSRVPPKYDTENEITEGKRIEKVRSPEWFRYYDEDDEPEFSTRLGPITRMNQRTTMLPKQMYPRNLREAEIFIV